MHHSYARCHSGARNGQRLGRLMSLATVMLDVEAIITLKMYVIQKRIRKLVWNWRASTEMFGGTTKSAYNPRHVMAVDG